MRNTRGMKTLKEYIYEAQENKRAIGHFNIGNIETLWAIVEALQEVSDEAGYRVPVVIGTSEGERDALGARQVVALTQSIRDEYDYPLFLNADHCHGIESFKVAVDAGYDMAIIDAADKSFDENVSITREAYEYARKNNPSLLVEAELGYIGTSSALLDALPEGAFIEGAELPTSQMAQEFVQKTEVDLFAPAVGNLHGMLKNAPNPRLQIELIWNIQEATGVPLVLHGGSGVSSKDFVSAIEAGVSVIHINTELRVAYRKKLEESLRVNPDEISPYKYTKDAKEMVKNLVKEKVRLFTRLA